ncbi:hypothetical protein FA13DRAFT_1740721 [Coprinellus micaceus]|uniref:Uncharacterized protein n=1 Tax=Coprinellus micaceus TaxID=71717 RepID=A0A4Y7SM16_COPMI|nr:hypothetical protein FA13DRAFT_1740721 [Coprinellus micaceus]
MGVRPTFVNPIHDHRLDASLNQPAFRFVKSIAQELPNAPDSPSNPRPARAATGILIYGCCVSAEKVLLFPTRMRPHHFTRPLSGPPSSTNGVRPPPIPPLRASFLPNVLAISGLPVERSD